MFKKGLELMEELFPGYKQKLSWAGALEIDQISHIYFVRSLPASTMMMYKLAIAVFTFCQLNMQCSVCQTPETQWKLRGLHRV